MVINIVMWLSLLVANQKDPGFLAKNTDEYHRFVLSIVKEIQQKNDQD